MEISTAKGGGPPGAAPPRPSSPLARARDSVDGLKLPPGATLDPTADTTAGSTDPATSPAPSAPIRAKPVQSRGADIGEVVTPSGRSIATEMVVVDAGDLTASNNPDFSPNPNYPMDLQPRDRTRAQSQAQVQSIASNLDPRLLGASATAGEGAPIIGPDGVVESGNGRALAIGLAYARNLPSAQRYREHLKSQGIDTAGIANPVLVRRRLTELSASDRVAFARESNARNTLSLSSGEQAKSDAAALRDDLLDLVQSDNVSAAANRKFVKAAIEAITPESERGNLLTKGGGLSQDGQTRLENALFAKAYDDVDVLSSLREDTSGNIRGIAGALVDAAPSLARLRADIAAGRVDPSLDVSEAVLDASRLVREARKSGASVSDTVAQQDAFDRLSPEAETILGLMFRDDAYSRPVSRRRIADALRHYAAEARKATTDPGLSLGLPDVSALDILKRARSQRHLDLAGGVSQDTLTPDEIEADNALAVEIHDAADTAESLIERNGVELKSSTRRDLEILKDGQRSEDAQETAGGGLAPSGATGLRSAAESESQDSGSLAQDAGADRAALGLTLPDGAVLDDSEDLPGGGGGNDVGGGTLPGVPLSDRDTLDGVTIPADILGEAITKARELDMPLIVKQSGGKIIKARGAPSTGDYAIIYPDKSVRVVQQGGATLFSGFDPAAILKPYQRAADKLLNAIHGKGGWRLAPLKKLPQQRAYLIARYQALGNIANVDEIGRKLFDVFKPATKSERAAVYEYLTTKGDTGARIKNPDIRAAAQDAKGMLEDVGRRLVERGLLSQEVFEQHRGEYLPRVYLKHLLGGPQWMRSGKKPDMGYLKERKDIPEDVRKLILGEITDPGYLTARGYIAPMRDIAMLDLLDTIAQNPAWTYSDSLVEWEGGNVSASWLDGEARRLRDMARAAPDADRASINGIADKMEAAAKAGLLVGDPPGFKRIPDVPRYGKLRGLYVRKEIANDLFGSIGFIPEDPSWAETWLGQGGKLTKATQLWKLSKVALNPPTQVRNMVSNAIMLQLSGISIARLPDRIIRAAAEVARNGEHWKIAKKYGITASSFASQELYQLNEFVRRAERMSGNPTVRLLGLLKTFLGKPITGFAKLYGLSEAVFKTAKIIDEMAKGRSEANAVLEAQKWIFDYSLVPQSVRYLRNSPVGVPFLTYYYKVAPRLMEVAVKHPWRFAPYIAMAYALPALIADMWDVDEDDLEAINKAMPEWLRRRSSAMILPVKDGHGRWQVVDLGYFMPWSYFSEVGARLGDGNITGAMEAGGAGGAPLFSLYSALINNVDPFTKREIARKGDPPAQQLSDKLAYLWRLAMPSWLTDRGAVDRTVETLQGKVNPRTGDPTLTETQAFLRFAGVNVYPIDPTKSRADNIRRMTWDIRRIQQQMRYKLRDRNLDAATKREIVETYKTHLAQKVGELRRYRGESKVNPKLLGPPKRGIGDVIKRGLGLDKERLPDL